MPGCLLFDEGRLRDSLSGETAQAFPSETAFGWFLGSRRGQCVFNILVSLAVLSVMCLLIFEIMGQTDGQWDKLTD